jgi:hypothetical protein
MLRASLIQVLSINYSTLVSNSPNLSRFAVLFDDAIHVSRGYCFKKIRLKNQRVYGPSSFENSEHKAAVTRKTHFAN